MTTREDRFKAELIELLRKYDVKITAEEGTRDYETYETYCSGISFYSPAKWENSECVRENIKFTTDSCIDGKTEI